MKWNKISLDRHTMYGCVVWEVWGVNRTWRQLESLLIYYIVIVCRFCWSSLLHREVRGLVKFNYRACRRPVSCSRTLRHVCVCLKGTLLLQSSSITLVVTSVFVCMCIFMCVFLLLLLSRDLLRSWAVPVSTIWLLVPLSLLAHIAYSFPASHNHAL